MLSPGLHAINSVKTCGGMFHMKVKPLPCIIRYFQVQQQHSDMTSEAQS